jgi:hypothetical protein
MRRPLSKIRCQRRLKGSVQTRNDAATIAGADEKPPAVASSLLDTLDEFVNARSSARLFRR